LYGFDLKGKGEFNFFRQGLKKKGGFLSKLPVSGNIFTEIPAFSINYKLPMPAYI
jgi:hypothetical protein